MRGGNLLFPKSLSNIRGSKRNMPDISHHSSTNIDYSKYHIQCNQDQSKPQMKLVQQLIDLGVEILYFQYPKHWFIIPSQGAAYHLHSQDLRSNSIEALITDIRNFIEKYPYGIIIAEGFHRWGESNRKKWQLLITNLFFTPLDISTAQSKSKHTAMPIFIPGRNTADSIEILLRIAHREQISDLPPKLSRISEKRVFLADAQIYLIKGLLNCGKKKAIKLLEKFDSPAAVFDAIINSPDEITAISGFGKKFIRPNQKMLSEILLPTAPTAPTKNEDF